MLGGSFSERTSHFLNHGVSLRKESAASDLGLGL